MIYENGTIREMTDEERREFAGLTETPTAAERLEAQVLFTALMTGTLMSGGEAEA